VFFHAQLWHKEESYLLAGDEVVVSKAGKKTHGLDRFFSGLYGKPIVGVSFFVLSLVSVEQRQSYPVGVEQRHRSDKETTDEGSGSRSGKKRGRPKGSPNQAKASVGETMEKPKGKPGCPKGSKNKPKGETSEGAPRRGGRPKGSPNRNKQQVVLSQELSSIQTMVKALLHRIGSLIPLRYLLLDGYFGHHAVLQMARQLNLHLISKLRHDAALYFPYDPASGTRRCKYGERLDLQHIPPAYGYCCSRQDAIQTDLYQMQMLHKEFAEPINVVLLVKTNLKTGAKAHVLLFSSDLSLKANQLLDYYSLRFQIEFNFRDAKQFWGLEDFMNIAPTPLTNAVNLAFLMVNLSTCLLRELRTSSPQAGIVDLKAYYRGIHYVHQIIKLLPIKLGAGLVDTILAKAAAIGRIHPLPKTSSAA
jgi:putative transposase